MMWLSKTFFGDGTTFWNLDLNLKPPAWKVGLFGSKILCWVKGVSGAHIWSSRGVGPLIGAQQDSVELQLRIFIRSVPTSPGAAQRWQTTSHTEHSTSASHEHTLNNYTAHCALCTLCTAFCVHCMMVHSVGGVCPAFIHSTNSSTLGSDAVQGCNIHQHHLILVQLLLLLLLLMMLMIMAQCKVTIYTSSNLILLLLLLLLLLRFQLKTMKMLQLLKSKESRALFFSVAGVPAKWSSDASMVSLVLNGNPRYLCDDMAWSR